MPTARNVGRSSGRVGGGPVIAVTPSCSQHSMCFNRCTMAPETRPLPAVSRQSRAHPACDVDRLSSGVRRAEAVIPRPVVRGADGRCASPVAIPPYPPLCRFGRNTAGYVDRPQAAMGSRHRPGTAPGPAGDPPRRRSNSDHAGKTAYSGDIESLDRDPGIATLVPGTRFPGN